MDDDEISTKDGNVGRDATYLFRTHDITLLGCLPEFCLFSRHLIAGQAPEERRKKSTRLFDLRPVDEVPNSSGANCCGNEDAYGLRLSTDGHRPRLSLNSSYTKSAMKRQDRAKIDSLLHELRSWDPDADPPEGLDELALRFQLDPLVVKRLAQSEGWNLNGDGVPEEILNDDTAPIDINEK